MAEIRLVMVLRRRRCRGYRDGGAALKEDGGAEQEANFLAGASLEIGEKWEQVLGRPIPRDPDDDDATFL